jgi:hypothetical protein
LSKKKSIFIFAVTGVASVTVVFFAVLLTLYLYHKLNPKEYETGYITSEVRVVIKPEYYDKFDNNEFTVADFLWDNAESIRFNEGSYHKRSRYYEVTLKEHGLNFAEEAVAHFNTLYFVEYAELIGFKLL